MSKTDRIVFSGKEHFSYFEEQFEARIFHLKLNKILDETVDYRNFMPSLRPNASSDQKQAAIDKRKEIFEEKRLHIWYELVQALDKKSVLFLRSYKGNDSKAWDVLRKMFKSFERPRLQKLISELTTLKKNSNETVIDYFTRAEEIQYNLEQTLISIILKGLPKQFETFSTIAKFSRDEKSLDELKRDLVNFDSERQVIEKEHAFNSENRVCFKCHKRGHVWKQCRQNVSSRRDSEDRARKIQCYECKEFGHIAKYCQAKKKFISKTKREQQNLVAETEAHLSFLSGVSPGEDLVVDSGATSKMIKDRDMFVSLDENFKGSVSNANFSESQILGKGEVRFRVKDEKGEFKMIELKDTLYVPENSRNLLNVSKMKKAGAEVVFGASSIVRQGNGSVYPL